MADEAIQRANLSDPEPRVAAFLTSVGRVLVPGEQIESWAIRRRLFAVFSRRTFILATTGRLLIFTRKLLGGYELSDVRWQDLSKIEINVGLLSSRLLVGYMSSTDLSSDSAAVRWISVGGLRSSQAEDVYRLCQAHEQAWREKRRVRELEQMRAKAGGVQIGGAAALPASGESGDPAERLQRAKDMLAKKLITDAEYEGIKARIVSGL